MASTYTVNIGIEKPGTGDQSGTWGNTTNTNFDIIDQATNGVATVTLAAAGTSGSPNTLLINNGALSDGRNRFIEFNDGADLGATAYVQLDPNDAEKIVHIRNSLSASRSLILFQGTYNASNDFEVPNGADVLVKFDGGGTGATVTDVNVNLTPTKVTTGDLDVDNININGNTISSTDTNGNINLVPNGTGEVNLTDNDKLTFGAGSDLQIYHDGLNSYIHDNGTGDLKILADNFRVANAADTEDIIRTVSDGAVTLYHDNVAKLATTVAGVDVTGTVTADGLTVDGTSTLKNVTVGVDGTYGGNYRTIGFSGNANGSTRIFGTTDDSDNLYIAAGTGKGVNFWVNGSSATVLKVESNGNVGIGTASPTDPLHIKSVAATNVLIDAPTDNASLTLQCGSSDAGAESAFVQFIQNTTPKWQMGMNTDNTFRWYNYNTLSEAMQIDSSGRLGIGTSSPISPLHVATTSQIVGTFISTGADPQIYLGDAATTDNAFILGYDRADNRGYLTVAGDSDSVLTIVDGGNVGIGTSSPQEQIHSYAGGSNALRVSGGANNNKKVEIGYDNTNGPYIKAGSSGVTGLQFYVDNTSLAATIDSSGRLGIGTGSPIAQSKLTVAGNSLSLTGSDADFGSGGVRGMLDLASGYLRMGSVNGGGSANGIKLVVPSGGEALVVDSVGNVGIGTSSPAYTLQVGEGNGQMSLGNATIGNGSSRLKFLSSNSQKNWQISTNDNIGGALEFTQTTAGGGTTFSASPAMLLTNGGNLRCVGVYNQSAADSANVVVDASGNIYRSTSALKYKQDIRDIEEIDISQFRPIRYKSNLNRDDQTKDHFGFIADEAHDAGYTELVSYGAVNEETGIAEVEGFRYDRMTVLLTKVVQQQQATITALEARIAALEAN
jgi:hypothetical protein